MNEAAARVRINKLLEAAGWRFFDEKGRPGNVRPEQGVVLRSPSDLDALGEDFEKVSRGSIDFLLLDGRGFPLIVLEAKSEKTSPLAGKEQARKYARSQNCRFVILSNGGLHYFWDLERGDPRVITSFPTPESMDGYREFSPDPARLAGERVEADYIARTRRPNYDREAAWRSEGEREGFIRANGLRFLRDYQLRAVRALQRAARGGSDRFLFEMATGAGKTLTAAAVVKLFLRTGNARRVLFLVDRLELEAQAARVFTSLLSEDYATVVYKQRREDWRRAEIVVTTVQSLLSDNKYRRLFSPTDFDLVISDEAHRSIGGNARAVFDYFLGWKLGLTATPRDYLKNFDEVEATVRDPRAVERRLLLDTYRAFGCESGQPTFRYSLIDGVRDGHLISPIAVDARTDVTARLLSERGFVAAFADEEGGEREEAYGRRHFEKEFYSEATNRLFCRVFMENALRDPVSGEIGKSIVFAVSQDHAAKLTQILNRIADRMFPNRYRSDFALQVTSRVADAQQFALNFANNRLLGSGNFLPGYLTSKARVCVTVGMMTTGYDCADVLNVGLFRPVFSPADFVQIKGRGARPYDFREEMSDEKLRADFAGAETARKRAFKLFDFFANCEYFEKEFDYGEALNLPRGGGGGGFDPNAAPEASAGGYEYGGEDFLEGIEEQPVGPEGMKVDRMLFEKFSEAAQANEAVADAVEKGEWERAIDRVRREVFGKPEEYFNVDKLRRAAGADRRVSLREILERAFGLIPGFRSRRELLEEEFDKFLAEHAPGEDADVPAMRRFFEAYATSEEIRPIIDERRYAELAANPAFPLDDLRGVPEKYRRLIPDYVRDYVPLNRFLPYP